MTNVSVRSKLIDATYENGISTVKLQTPLGVKTGTARLHADDAKFASSLVGCQYAEFRALIQYYKDKVKQLKVQLKAYITLKNDCGCAGIDRSGESTYKILLTHINMTRKEIADYEAVIQAIEEQIATAITERDELHKKLKDKNK